MKNARISKRKRQEYKRKMLEQKLIGIGMLILSAFVIVMALHGLTPEDRDATPVLIFAPLGLYLLFSKECWII